MTAPDSKSSQVGGSGGQPGQGLAPQAHRARFFGALAPTDLLTALIVFVVLIAVGLCGSKHPSSLEESGHALQAKAFSKRRLDLEPSPVERASYSSTGSCTLVNGKYYLTLGPGPAALVYLPLQQRLGVRLDSGLLAGVLAGASYVFSVALLAGIFQSSFGLLSSLQRALALICLGMGNLTPLLAGSPTDSSIAILWSQTWLAAAAFFYHLTFRGGAAIRHAAMMASICMGLSITGHPSALLLAFLALLMPLFPSPVRFWRRSDRLFCFLGPCLTLMALVVIANISRFGTWYDFGRSVTPSGQSLLTFAFEDPLALAKSISIQISKATIDPVGWVSQPPCKPGSVLEECRNMDIGILLGFPALSLIFLIPLLLVARRLLMAQSLDRDPPLPAAPTVFVVLTLLIQLSVTLTGIAGLSDPTQLPAGLDWAATTISVIYGVMGLILLAREPGWAAVSSIVVPVCFMLSILMGLALSPLS